MLSKKLCLLGIVFLVVISGAPALADQALNPVSQFPVTVDGQFTGGVVGGVLQGEWSDVTPLAFISPATPGGTLFQVPVGDSRANSLLYAANAPGTAINDGVDLYLMYDYLPRTNPNFAPGELMAEISFPINIGNQELPSQFCPECGPVVDATVRFEGPQLALAAASTLTGGGGSAAGISVPANVLVSLNGGPEFSAGLLGMDGAIGFGPSTFSDTPHLLAELEVPLLIPQGFLNPNSPPQNGVYSPDPAFWGATISNDTLDPPASAALFQIHPGGSISINSDGLPSVPEPTTLVMLLVGVTIMCSRRRPNVS